MRSKKTKLLLMIEILESSKTLLSENTFRKESITLKGHGKTIADNKKIAETLTAIVILQARQTTQTLSSEISRNMLIIQAY